jgi:YhcG PDDEXK nuclease domain
VALAYGAQIVAALGRQLDARYGRGFGDKNLRRMVQFALAFPDPEAGFAFVERQKRIVVDGDDYYIDLLFFHRRMRRLVAIELKLGDFKPADSGQVELYLRWLDRHERQPTEEAPLGISLCAGKKRETVEYLDLDARGIHVAEYLTELPPREVLQERLHQALAAAKSRLASAATDGESDVAPIGRATGKPATSKWSSKRSVASRGPKA